MWNMVPIAIASPASSAHPICAVRQYRFSGSMASTMQNAVSASGLAVRAVVTRKLSVAASSAHSSAGTPPNTSRTRKNRSNGSATPASTDPMRAVTSVVPST